MMYRMMTGLALVVVAGLLHSPTVADDEKKKQPSQLDQTAMEELYADFAALEPEHAYFKKFLGRWKAVNKMFMEGTPEPMVTEGTTSFRLILGGRYLQQRYESEFDGMAFEGIGISGYDKSRKKYIGMWMDNHSTSWMMTEGEYDEATKTMSDIGEMSTPMGPATAKTVSKEVDKNTFVFTMYMVQPDGSDQKHMEITYTRLPRAKKKKP